MAPRCGRCCPNIMMTNRRSCRVGIVQAKVILPHAGKETAALRHPSADFAQRDLEYRPFPPFQPPALHGKHGVAARGVEDLIEAASGLPLDLGQTGMASVMVTDIVDSSILAQAMGGAGWGGTVQPHLGDVQRLIERHGGRLVKSLGDGTMSTWPSAGQALEAAQVIQRVVSDSRSEPRFTMRIGVHTGDLVDAGDDFFGSGVNKAARVAGAPGPRESLVSDATRAMVGVTAGFAFSDLLTVTLKGIDGDQTVLKLNWAAKGTA